MPKEVALNWPLPRQEIHQATHVQLTDDLIVHRERILEAMRLAPHVVRVRLRPLADELATYDLTDADGRLWRDLQLLASTCVLINSK